MIKFNEPTLTGEELRYIEEVFQRNQFYGAGHFTQLCEAQIALHVPGSQILLTDSCTSALEMIALLIRRDREERFGKDPGIAAPEIILPSYTFSSTAAAFAKNGFDIVFADINEHDLMITPQDVQQRITERTVAVVAVHYGSQLADLGSLRRLCGQNGLLLVEDAAQAYGSARDGLVAGTVGDFGAFSFHETKNIHCGLGGALVLQHARHFDPAHFIRERGTNRKQVLDGVVDKYSWVEIGGSYYPTELQAAFLYPQLLAFPKIREVRRRIYEHYVLRLQPYRAAGLLQFDVAGSDSNYHSFFAIARTKDEATAIRKHLNKNHIQAYIGYVPLHTSPVGKRIGRQRHPLPVTEQIADRVIRFPFHNRLTIADIDRIADQVQQVFPI